MGRKRRINWSEEIEDFKQVMKAFAKMREAREARAARVDPIWGEGGVRDRAYQGAPGLRALTESGAESAPAPVQQALPQALPLTSALQAAKTSFVAQPPSVQAAALLTAISGGSYGASQTGTRWTPNGRVPFENFDDHPRTVEVGARGPNDAAGRYLLSSVDWDAIPPGWKGDGFSAEGQNLGAWYLGQRAYHDKTGGDLQAELATNGFSPQVANALSDQWPWLQNPNLLAKAQDHYATALSNADALDDDSDPSAPAAQETALPPEATQVTQPSGGDWNPLGIFSA